MRTGQNRLLTVRCKVEADQIVALARSLAVCIAPEPEGTRRFVEGDLAQTDRAIGVLDMSDTAGPEIHVEDADRHPLADLIGIGDRLPDRGLRKGDGCAEVQIEALAGGFQRGVHRGAFNRD